MSLATVKIMRHDWQIVPRLSQLHLEKAKLLRVRNIAVGAAAEATRFHPANAAGTLSYQHGTFALRNEHVGTDGWVIARPNGVEAIANKSVNTRLVFANVDVACNDEHEPRARSSKGAGAERLCAGNGLFGDLPRFTRSEDPSPEGWITFYLMVAPDGAVELSRAKVEHGQFGEFYERLYLADGSDLDVEPNLVDDDQPIDVFDPQVARK